MVNKAIKFLTDYGTAITAVGVIVGAIIYVGILHQRVANAEDEIRQVKEQVLRADKTGEDRVVRIYDKLDGFSKKLDEFTKDQRDHMMADANMKQDIALSLQTVSHDLKAIREDLNRRKK